MVEVMTLASSMNIILLFGNIWSKKSFTCIKNIGRMTELFWDSILTQTEIGIIVIPKN